MASRTGVGKEWNRSASHGLLPGSLSEPVLPVRYPSPKGSDSTTDTPEQGA